MKKIIALALLVSMALTFSAVALNKQEEKENKERAASTVYDTSDLACEELVGNCRMSYARYYDANGIETTDGNVWDVSTDSINPYELLLVWFDDMGTEEIEDDTIIEIWRTIYD